ASIASPMRFRTAPPLAPLFALALAVWPAGARADPPKAAPPAPVQSTIAERSASAAEDATQTISAADLGSPTAGERFAGKPIVRVEAVTVGKLWPSQERVTSVKAGETYSGEAARRAVREMLGTGRFARAGVEAYPEGAGVVLRLALLPRRVIASLTLT